jgi:hypothetical protein
MPVRQTLRAIEFVSSCVPPRIFQTLQTLKDLCSYHTNNKMAKKRPRSSAATKPASLTSGGGWQPVSVSLAKADETVFDTNHYDDDHDDEDVRRHASSGHNNKEDDLEAGPAETMGMFYDLQVIPADQYRVETKEDGTKHFRILGEEDAKKEYASGASTDKTKKRKERSVSNRTSDQDLEAAKAADDDAEQEPRKKKPKKKKPKKDRTTSADDDADAMKPSTTSFSEQDILSLQQSWLIATGGVSLHVDLCHGLLAQNFHAPMPIQAATLPATILGRRNLVGAAPTGSGKTLAFLLPILQYLLEQQEQGEVEADVQSENDDQEASIMPLDAAEDERDEAPRKLQALILAPTRELAMQIHKECDKLVPRQIGTIVGGLALAKQARVLTKNKPAILVGTPGRLWELVRTRLVYA